MVFRRIASIAMLTATVSLARPAAQQHPRVWIGVGFNAEKLSAPLPAGEATVGLRITTIGFDSPAERAGLLINDFIIGADGREFTAEPALQDKKFRESILQHAPGELVMLAVLRGVDVKDVRVIVEQRPDEMPIKDYSAPKVHWPEEELSTALIDEYK